MNMTLQTGNLVRNFELKYMGNGTPFATSSLAVNRGNDSVEFYPVIVYGNYAEKLAEIAQKGTKVQIVGSIKNSKYEVNGIKRNSAQIVIQNLIFM